jgi:hypothetical protein
VSRLAAVAAVLLLAAGCAGSHSGPSTGALRHHYYLVGKRACKHLVVSKPGSVEIFALNVNSYPAKYRPDVAAGCRADR